jgi:plasmid stabilization system protein ParE
MKILWTKESLPRLQEIEDYISRNNPDIAIEFIVKLITVTGTLNDNSEIRRVVLGLSLSLSY